MSKIDVPGPRSHFSTYCVSSPAWSIVENSDLKLEDGRQLANISYL